MLIQIGSFGIAIGHENTVLALYKEGKNGRCKGIGIQTEPEPEWERC